jgi:hypothetical protein
MKRIFPRGTTPDQLATAIARMVAKLDPAKSYAVTVEEWRKPRSNQQNAYLWGVVYPMVLEAGGEALAGWTRDDLHEYFLGEVWGWETLEGFGKKRLRPLKRTSRMTAAEFTEYLHGIENRLMDLGIGPLPEPIYAA